MAVSFFAKHPLNLQISWVSPVSGLYYISQSTRWRLQCQGAFCLTPHGPRALRGSEAAGTFALRAFVSINSCRKELTFTHINCSSLTMTLLLYKTTRASSVLMGFFSPKLSKPVQGQFLENSGKGVCGIKIKKNIYPWTGLFCSPEEKKNKKLWRQNQTGLPGKQCWKGTCSPWREGGSHREGGDASTGTGGGI